MNAYDPLYRNFSFPPHIFEECAIVGPLLVCVKKKSCRKVPFWPFPIFFTRKKRVMEDVDTWE